MASNRSGSTWLSPAHTTESLSPTPPPYPPPWVLPSLYSQSMVPTFFQAVPQSTLEANVLQEVADANTATAQELIQTNPRSLWYMGTVVDCLGNIIENATPYQAALRKHNDAMCEMIVEEFKKLPGGLVERARQYNEIFPNGLTQYYNSQKPYDFSSLVSAFTKSSKKDIRAALIMLQNGTHICQEMNQFRKAFATLSYSETVFNLKHLDMANRTLSLNFYNWSWDKIDLFWRQVIGYIQSFLPPDLVKQLAQGIYYIVNENKALSGSFRIGATNGFRNIYDFRDWRATHAYDVMTFTKDQLGSDTAMDNYGCAVPHVFNKNIAWGMQPVRLQEAVLFYESLLNRKLSKLKSLEPQPQLVARTQRP